MEETETAVGHREAFQRGVEAFRQAGLEDVSRDGRMEVMSAMFGLMRAGEYATLDDGIASLDPSTLSTTAILSLLRTTFMARLALPAWTAFRDGAADALDARDEPTAALLSGLWAPEGARMADAGAVRADPAGAFRAAWGAIAAGGREGFSRPHLDRALLAVRHLRSAGDLAPVDEALSSADPERLPDQTAIMLLRACRASRDGLPSWEGLRDRIGDFHHARGSGAQRLVADLGWSAPGPEAGAAVP